MKVVVPALLLLVAAVGCSDATGVNRVVEVEMLDNRYTPDTIRVAQGTPVRWVNRGTVQHSARGAWFTLPLLAPGFSHELRMHHVGDYAYQCTLHPDMKGYISVR